MELLDPDAPSASDRAALESLYVSSGYQVRPVLEAILLHPDLYTGARMVRPPVVFLAGLLRLLRGSVDGEHWIWYGAAGTGFLIGSSARGEMVGEFPGLAQLDEDDNLRNTSDFRAVYCGLLEQWLEVDATPIIPNAASFTRPALVA